MKSANVAEIKTQFSSYLKMVMNGEPIEVCKRNVAVARMVPVDRKPINKTRLGCGKGSVNINGDITEPAISESSWNMLGDEDL